MIPHSKPRGLPVAVIDTTLLSRLAELEVAHLLPVAFKRIFVPPEVKREAFRAPGRRRLKKLISEMSGFFVDCHSADELIKNFLMADLDAGEAAAIAQADYHKSVVLLDERKGVKRAESMQLEVIRTLNLINMLKEAGALKEVRPYYDKLAQRGFYVKLTIRRKLLIEAGEEEDT